MAISVQHLAGVCDQESVRNARAEAKEFEARMREDMPELRRNIAGACGAALLNGVKASRVESAAAKKGREQVVHFILS